MKFASVRLVTNQVQRLAQFYQTLSAVAPVYLAEEFAEIRFGALVLAISGENLVKMHNAGAATAGANKSAILEFQVDNVDAVCDRMREADADIVSPPKTMPWGNVSLLLRDPDGNLVNVFSKPAA